MLKHLLVEKFHLGQWLFVGRYSCSATLAEIQKAFPQATISIDQFNVVLVRVF